MTMQNTRDLFVHELEDMYDAEKRIATILDQQIKETEYNDIQDRLKTHLQETKAQAQNLEKCFQNLGVPAETSSCFAMDGIKKEHDSFLKENPSPEILTLFNLGGATKTEFYEIASYESLITKSKIMGLDTCTKLLSDNLEQEKAMAEALTLFSQALEHSITPHA